MRWVTIALSAFFVLLHRPDGKPVYINAEQIDYIGPARENIDDPKAGALLMVYGIWVTVKEEPTAIKNAIDKVLKQE